MFAKGIAAAGLAVILSISSTSPSTSQSAVFVSPPRTIADIAAILDQEKPDPARLQRDQQVADQAAPKASQADLVKFYRDRARARAELGRLREAIADSEKALEHAQGRGDREILGVR